VGITSSSFFTTWLKKGPLGEQNYRDYFQAAIIINLVIVGVIVLS
jgi:hypothetical protein